MGMKKGKDFGRIGHVDNVDRWLFDLQLKVKPENIFVIGYVASTRYRDLFGDYVYTQLLEPIKVPRQNLIFSEDKTGLNGKDHYFVQLGLTHFIDTTLDPLKDIANKQWRANRAAEQRGEHGAGLVPRLFLLPISFPKRPPPPDKNSHKTCNMRIQRSVPRSWGPDWTPVPLQSLGEATEQIVRDLIL